ncbi:hypothetical protein MAR_008924 [Mya arenaria]|uniref:Uncharacterized protein n=1 Tax=Mya arenaria TaxID=6604 RepID=A0ABY7E5D9_MYAAR|nr:hypothetical protein MAR_008924 [Mya arenaria]
MASLYRYGSIRATPLVRGSSGFSTLPSCPELRGIQSRRVPQYGYGAPTPNTYPSQGNYPPPPPGAFNTYPQGQNDAQMATNRMMMLQRRRRVYMGVSVVILIMIIIYVVVRFIF